MSERLVYALESFIAAASRHTFSRDLPDYCDLRTIIRLTEEDRIRRPETEAPYIFSTRDGHYVSVLSVEGAFTEFDEDVDGLEQSLETWVDTLATALNAEFGRPGHKISMVYERDPAQGQAEIDHLLTPQYQSIRRLGLNIRESWPPGSPGNVAGWLSGHPAPHCPLLKSGMNRPALSR